MKKMDLYIGELLSLLRLRSKRIQRTIAWEHFVFTKNQMQGLKKDIQETRNVLDAIEAEAQEICYQSAAK